jgi:hypothetical protein
MVATTLIKATTMSIRRKNGFQLSSDHENTDEKQELGRESTWVVTSFTIMET